MLSFSFLIEGLDLKVYKKQKKYASVLTPTTPVVGISWSGLATRRIHSKRAMAAPWTQLRVEPCARARTYIVTLAYRAEPAESGGGGGGSSVPMFPRAGTRRSGARPNVFSLSFDPPSPTPIPAEILRLWRVTVRDRCHASVARVTERSTRTSYVRCPRIVRWRFLKRRSGVPLVSELRICRVCPRDLMCIAHVDSRVDSNVSAFVCD